MMSNYWEGYSNNFVPGMVAGWMTTLIIPLTIWSIVWMGLGLWKAAKNGSKPWFIALLLIHTMGILDILYIFVFSKMGAKKLKKSK